MNKANNGTTLLAVTNREKDTEIYDMLIEHGADV